MTMATSRYRQTLAVYEELTADSNSVSDGEEDTALEEADTGTPPEVGSASRQSDRQAVEQETKSEANPPSEQASPTVEHQDVDMADVESIDCP